MRFKAKIHISFTDGRAIERDAVMVAEGDLIVLESRNMGYLVSILNQSEQSTPKEMLIKVEPDNSEGLGIGMGSLTDRDRARGF